MLTVDFYILLRLYLAQVNSIQAPSHKRIAFEWSCSESFISRRIRALSESGWLLRHHRSYLTPEARQVVKEWMN